MSLAFHFLKRDFRRASWLFAIWFLIYAVEAVLTATTTPPISAPFFVSLSRWLLYPILHVVVLGILVAQLIHEDPPVGGSAFWRTRPVSRGTLLLSKMAGLGLIVIVPAIVEAAALLALGFHWDGLGKAFALILVHQLSFALPFALVASLTPNFRWFMAVVLSIGAVIGLRWTMPATGNAYLFATDPFAADALIRTKANVGLALLVVGGSGLLAHQYLSRRTGRSVTFALCLGAAYFAVGMWWTLNLVHFTPTPVSNLPIDPAKVSLSVTPTSTGRNNVNGNVRVNVDGIFTFKGLPSDLLVQVRSTKPRLTALDGTSIRVFGGFSVPPTSPELDVMVVRSVRAALGGISVYSNTASGSQAALFAVDSETMTRYGDTPARLADDVDFVASRYQLVAETSLAKGSALDGGTVHSRIGQLDFRPDGVTLVLVESVIDPSMDYTVHFGPYPNDLRLEGDPIFLLLNRGRKEAVFVNGFIMRSTANEFHLGGLVVQGSRELPFGGEKDPKAPVIDSGWLTGATLVCVERVPVAEFEKSAEVDLPKLQEPWLSFKASGISTDAVQAALGAEIVIIVENDGSVSAGGSKLDDAELKSYLNHLGHSDPRVAIRTEGKAPMQKLSAVMEACRAAGISRFNLEAKEAN